MSDAEFEEFYRQNSGSRWTLNVIGALILGWIAAVILGIYTAR